LPAAYALARVRRARLSLVVHGIEAWKEPGRRLSGKLVREVDDVIAVSRLTGERLSGWSGLPMERITVIPNCVDLDRFVPAERDRTLAERYGLGAGPVMMTLGRLSSSERYKGVDEILAVLPRVRAAIPSIRYLVVGDGDDRERLEQKARSQGLGDCVVFAGRVCETEKVAHFALADLYVMPSTGEGFGIVLLEAAACGLPIVGSGIDGSREALLEGRLGQLVDPRDRDQLASAILGALQDRAPRQRRPGIEEFAEPVFAERVAQWLRSRMAP
jgi:glycosyltransferase involved in cell wall biosynthesis